MSRSVAALLLLAMAPLCAQAFAQSGPQLKKRGESTAAPQNVDQNGLPPEEDKSIATPVYGFNPLQAQKEIRTGNYYFKKGSYRAAAARFEEATKWNSNEPEAWLRLGEAQEKLRDQKAARAAYTKYLALAGESKIADEIRKKLEKLK
jgi:tetratricopeptide (TPR) repeat protein